MQTSLDLQASGLAAAAQPIAADLDTQKALREGDADSLLAAWRPVFDTLKRENNVANFLFFNANRFCLLRVHNPGRRGDQLEHYAAVEAERTGKTASGLDLASQGTLTLRVVQPVFEGDTLAGYVELSKKIEDVLQKLHTRPGIQLAVVIRKERLKRETWEEGMRELGREADWNRLSRNAVIYASQGRLPDAFSSWADRLEVDRSRGDTNREIDFDGKHWRVSATPLRDASGEVLGDLLILRDISMDKATFARLVAVSGAASAVVLALVLGFIYVLLRRTDAGIRAQQEALRESEQSYRNQFAENSAVMLLIDPADGAILDANAAALSFYGYSHAQLLAMRITGINTLSESEVRQAMLSIPPGRGKRFEFQHRLADTSVRDVEVSVTLIQFGGRGVLHSIAQDITERKRAEEALLREELFTKALLDSLPGIFYLYTYPELCLVRWNRNHEALLGFADGEIKDRHILDWHSPERHEAVLQAVEMVMEEGQAVLESALLSKDGHTIPFLMTGVRFEVPGQTYLMGVGIDITERKRAEELIEKRIVALTQPMESGAIAFEDLFNLDEIQRIQDEFALATGVASIITYPDGTPITAPSSFTRLCSEIIRKTERGCLNCFKSDAAIGRYHPEGPIVQPCLSGGLWDAGASIVVGDRHIANWLIGQVRDESQTEDGMRAYAREIDVDEAAFLEAFREVPPMSRQHFEQIAKTLFTVSGQLSTAAYQNIQQARFITERKKVEDALRESEGRLRDIMFGMADWVWEVDANNVYTYCSEKSLELYGLHREDMIGRNLYDFMPPDEASKVAAIFSECAASKAPIRDLENWTVANNGERICLLTNAVPLLDDQGNLVGYRGVDKDITERKRAEEEKAKLEEQLQQALKMESVGRLAGGVAHDFNNMLSVILGHTELVMEQVDPVQPIYEELAEIRKAAERSADLTRQLLAFARKQTVAPRVLDLNEVVAGMLKMLQRLIGEDIDLVWLPGAGLGPLKVDPSQIDQILANLCVNARDAIADVGKISIETGNSTFDEEYCAAHSGVVPGEYVRLAVSDDGCGMDKETLSHLFEPFFTTKGIGKGTGLGLATVYGAVMQNDGYVSAYSEPGIGTTFTIYLPRYLGKTEQLQAKSLSEVNGDRHATVLLVEDEPTILNMCRTMLERLGYNVVSAVTPDEAIRLAETHPGEIDLLMTDVVMPEMNGRDLAKNLLSLYPHIKRLFMSGYTADVIAHHGVLDEGVYFIQKPFSKENLADKIREVLDGD